MTFRENIPSSQNPDKNGQDRRGFLKTMLASVVGVGLGLEGVARAELINPNEVHDIKGLTKLIGSKNVEILLKNPHLLKILQEQAKTVESKEIIKQVFRPLILLSANKYAVGVYFDCGARALKQLNESEFDFQNVFIANQSQVIKKKMFQILYIILLQIIQIHIFKKKLTKRLNRQKENLLYLFLPAEKGFLNLEKIYF